MPGIIKTELGSISIPDEIVATIAGYAASENYGIVGMHAKFCPECGANLMV